MPSLPNLPVQFLPLICLVACNGAGSTVSASSSPDDSALTPIYQVQGTGASSPLEDQQITVVGVVTGDFQDGDADRTRNFGGFYLQEQIPDGDSQSSDGVFVFDRNAASADVETSQTVRVSGTVTERFGETQIVADSVVVTGTGTVQPVPIPLPADVISNSDGVVIADLEHVEGMLVSLSEPAYISDAFGLERFGELSLSSGGRLMQFTNRTAPDIAGYAAYVDQRAGRQITLDDGQAVQNPSFLRYLRPTATGVADYTVRLGDTVTVATGNIRFSRGSGGSGKESYRLVPTVDPVFMPQNSVDTSAPVPGGQISIASFNVLNYFTTLDNGEDICGPATDVGCRGADSAVEFERQQLKTVNALLRLDADVVGLMELENNGGVALQNIVDAMNARAATGTWSYIDTGFVGSDVITVGLIYRTLTVQPAGDFALMTSAIDDRFDDTKNRPALVQSFDAVQDDGRFTVAVNHLKSKGSPCDDSGDINISDGQGNCNLTRTRAAQALVDWLNTDPTGSGDPDFLVIGDLNAYLQEDPVGAFEAAGYVNLLETRVGVDAYSFVFDSQSGALDHALASPSLAGRVASIAEWHINADEPALFDYNLEFDRAADIFDAESPRRSSDHDPVIVGIDP
ncbi:MAG: ExeM/NucH family extracellular endonuclease [Woeseiaceae bacterium]